MTQQLLPESLEKTQKHVESRETRPDSAQSFQGGLHPITQLQRTLGNRNVAKLIQARRLTPEGKITGLQRKLTVGAADDQYEQEADRVARQVMNTPDAVVTASAERAPSSEGAQNQTLQTKPLAASITPIVQRQRGKESEVEEDREEEKDESLQAKSLGESAALPLQRQMATDEKEAEPIQAKSAGSMTDSFEAGADVETQLSLSKGRGSPLPDPVRAFMEPRFGVDFSHVRVHAGNEAQQMNQSVGAQAFTHGSDIYFGAGHSPSNLELTAHELTHVVQQTGSPPLQTKKREEEVAPLVPAESSVQRVCAACAVEDREEKESDPNTIAAPPQNALSRSVAPPASAGTVIQRDWLDDAADAVSDTASSVAGTVSDAASSAAQSVSDVADAVSDTAGAVADAAADALSGLLDSALGALKSAFNAVVGTIGGAWDRVRTGVTNAAETALQGAIGFLGGLGSLFGAVASALASLDVGILKTAWAAVTGAAAAAVAGVRGIVAGVTATVDELWAGLKGLAESAIGGLRSQAEEVIGRLPSAVQGAARSAWATIEEQVTSTWRSIESGWTSLRTSALQGVTEVVAQVEAVAASIKNAGVEAVIATLEQGKAILDFARQVIANPDIIIDPIVQTVVGLLQDVPEKAKTEAQNKIAEQAGGAAPAATGPVPALTGAAPRSVQRFIQPAALPGQRLIQRQGSSGGGARTTLGFEKTVSGVWKGITDKLGALWADLWGQVKKMVLGVLDPREIAKGLGEDWNNLTKELSVRAKRIESVRTDSWGNFFEDLGRFISNILDFPLIVWRTINAMLGRLSVYIGLAIVLGGAVMGAIAAGTGGAIFGSVIPAAGTAGGGAAGVLAGAWAGATAGYAAAETVGLALLASFIVAEELSIVKAIGDLLLIPQTEEEQEEDVNQASDSIVAMVTAAALILIAWMAVSLAKMVFAFIKGIVVRVRGGGGEPPGTKPKPVEIPVGKKGFAICRSCLDNVNTPPELLARRNALPPEVGEFLDNKIKNNPGIFKDPANPTPADFKAAKGIMDSAEKLGEKKLGPGKTPQEYLEAGLREQMPKVSAPIGDPAAIRELPRLDQAMRQVVQEIEDFAKANPDKPNAAKMGDQLKSLLEGTFKDQLEGRQPITDQQVLGYDGQIKGARGELAEGKLAPSGTDFNVIIDGVEFDQVRPDGSLFQTKSLRAARGPSPKQPLGNVTYQKAIAQVKLSLDVAERPANLHNGQPRKVIIKFPEGLTKDVAVDMRSVTSPQGNKATIIADEIVLDPL